MFANIINRIHQQNEGEKFEFICILFLRFLTIIQILTNKLSDFYIKSKNMLKSKYLKYGIGLFLLIILTFSTYNQAKDSISELLLEWTDDNFKISTQRKGNITEYNKITKSDNIFKTFEELEKSLKDNNVKLEVFKPSYVPEGYQLNDISVNYDMQVHITIRYINRSVKDNEQSFTYSIYSVSNSNTDINSKLIQEKTSEEVEIYKALNGIECYIFSNINWKVATFVKDYDIYSIYGLNDKIELKKIIDGLY